MKHSVIASLAALSLCLSSAAMAKDINAIDVFVGDFAGVASFDFDKLASNKMLDDAFTANAGSIKDVSDIIGELKEAGIDYKKDIDSVTAAVNDKGHACAVVDAKVDLSKAFEVIVKKGNPTVSEYNGVSLYTDKLETSVLLNNKRILTCENVIDIKPMIDNAKAAKPKTLKESNSKVFKAYNTTSAKADIRVGAKMTPAIKKMVASYKLDGENGASVKVSDVDTAAVSINLSKGLDIAVVATAASEDITKNGADIINATIMPFLSDPSIAELGLGFVKDGVKIVAEGKNLKATVKFSDEQMTAIAAIVAELTGAVKK